MPNAFTELLQAGDADSRTLLGTPGTLARRGAVYATPAVILSPADSELVYAAGGAELQVKATATVNRQAVPQPPSAGDSLVTGGIRYYIVRVVAMPHDPVYHLTLAN